MLHQGSGPWHHRPDSDPCSLQLSCLLLARVPIPDLPKPKSKRKTRHKAEPNVRTQNHILNTWLLNYCELRRYRIKFIDANCHAGREETEIVENQKHGQAKVIHI
jgi:hypothetical protein